MNFKHYLAILIFVKHIYKVQSFNIFNIVNKYYISEKNTSNFHTKVIMQPLDHFDPELNARWQMRYFENMTYHKENGPVYIYLGDILMFIKTIFSEGLIFEMATETDGGIVAIEPRYYGNNFPVTVKRTEDFKYLTTRQILEDIAIIIKDIKSRPQFRNSAVVVIGWYFGQFASWMKVAYPTLVKCAISILGRALAIKNFNEAAAKLQEFYHHFAPPGCLDRIIETLKDFDMSFKLRRRINRIKKRRHICKDTNMTIPENQQFFFMREIFGLNYHFGDKDDLAQHCSYLLNEKILDFAGWDIMWANKECFNSSFAYFVELFKERFELNAELYQKCTEFGQFMTTDSGSHDFTRNVPLSFYLKLCSSVFGEKIDEKTLDDGVNRTNSLYGANNPRVAGIIYVNAIYDLDVHLAVHKHSYDDPSHVIYIFQTSKSGVLFPLKGHATSNDKAVRYHIKMSLKETLDTDYSYEMYD